MPKMWLPSGSLFPQLPLARFKTSTSNLPSLLYFVLYKHQRIAKNLTKAANMDVSDTTKTMSTKTMSADESTLSTSRSSATQEVVILSVTHRFLPFADDD